MLSKIYRVYWDGSVFLEYLQGNATLTCDALFASARKGEIEIMTSVLSVTEVSFAEEENRREHPDPAVDEAIAALWADARAIKLVEYNMLIAHEAQLIVREGLKVGVRMSLRDTIHLATARRMQVREVHTSDASLTKAGVALGFTVHPPKTIQPLLPFEMPLPEPV